MHVVSYLLVLLKLLFSQPSFPKIVRPIEWATICPSQEEVAVCADNKYLMEVDDNILLNVGYPKLILQQRLRPPPNVLVKYYYHIKQLYYYFLNSLIDKTEDHHVHRRKCTPVKIVVINYFIGLTSLLKYLGWLSYF